MILPRITKLTFQDIEGRYGGVVVSIGEGGPTKGAGFEITVPGMEVYVPQFELLPKAKTNYPLADTPEYQWVGLDTLIKARSGGEGYTLSEWGLESVIRELGRAVERYRTRTPYTGEVVEYDPSAIDWRDFERHMRLAVRTVFGRRVDPDFAFDEPDDNQPQQERI